MIDAEHISRHFHDVEIDFAFIDSNLACQNTMMFEDFLKLMAKNVDLTFSF